MPDNGTTIGQRRTGVSIHLLTASGAVAGMIALQSVFSENIKAALLWLIACQILDGVDGPIARRFNVELHAPHIDGHVLDLVIDYVTCVVVPVVLLLNMNIIADDLAMTIAGLILITSALWFARTDQETDDVWFNGFPAMWNIVVPTFVLLDTPQRMTAVICVLLCASQMTTIKFPHLVRVRAFRRPTYTVTVLYFAILTWLSAVYPNGPEWAKGVFLIGPAYLSFVVVWRTWFADVKVFGQSITTPAIDGGHH